MAATADFATALFLYATGPTVAAVDSRPSQRRSLPHTGLTLVVSQTAVAATASTTAPVDLPVLTEPVETAADRSVGQLLRLGTFGENWDGYKAAKPNDASVNAARKFLRTLAPGSVVPEPTLHADGNALLFYRSADSYVEIEFVDQNRIEFFARRGVSEWSDQFTLDGPMPVGLLEIGFAI
jgi:hypothetical protein